MRLSFAEKQIKFAQRVSV